MVYINYTGNEDIEPQVWPTDLKRSFTDKVVHNPCGHWHKKKAKAPMLFMVPPVPYLTRKVSVVTEVPTSTGVTRSVPAVPAISVSTSVV